MKQNLFTLCLALCCAIQLFAYDFEVDDIYYNKLQDGTSVEVTYYTRYIGKIVIPASVTYKGTTYCVASIGAYAFSKCSGLTSITIPESVTTIGVRAFYDCTGLTSITIPNGVTSIEEYAFSKCSGLTSVTISEGVTSIGEAAFYGCFRLTSVTIPNGVTSIAKEAFYYCYGLTSVTIPNSVTSIGDSAFYDCSRLTSVTIPEGVTSIGESAFSGCYRFTSITIPNSVTSIGDNAFSCCNGLTSITIPESVTSIGEEAFQHCYGLTSVTIPNSVTSIGKHAFYYCDKLQYNTFDNAHYLGNSENPYHALISAISISIQSNRIHQDTKIIADYAFYECGYLNPVTIPNGVTSIGKGAFRHCWSSLAFITIPNSVTSIGESAFRSCSNLISVTIPNSVTSIEESTFRGCPCLTSITIPNSVTSIGEEAFAGCYDLNSVKIKAINPPIGNGGLGQNKDCIISVPCSALEAYQHHRDWMFLTLQDYLEEYTVSVTNENTTQGTTIITQEPTCDNDITAIIQATPNKGYRFVAWNDGNTDNPRSINVTQDTIFTAKFAEIPVSAITLNETTLLLPIGDTHQLMATVVPDDALNQNITWSTSNATIATVANGLVTALAKGQTTITATTEDGGYTATCEVMVTDETALDNVSAESSSNVQKVLENGTIYILRNGEKYTIDGRKVE